VEDGKVVADWKPEPYHEAFEGYVNGGIIGVLFDCHSNWAAAYSLMERRRLAAPPGTVTAEYCVTHISPTPIISALHFVSKVVDLSDNKVKTARPLTAICGTKSNAEQQCKCKSDLRFFGHLT
jgi:hypothetical protein